MHSNRNQQQKMIALSDIIAFKTDILFKRFCAMKMNLECKKEERCKVHVSRVGLATTLEVRCTYRSQRCDGHSWKVEPA